MGVLGGYRRPMSWPGSPLWRVRSYVRPYAGQMVTMVLTAVAGLTAQTVIPLVTKSVIDGPVAHHRRGAVLGLVGVVLALGATESFLAWVRRWVQSRAANG